MLLIKLCCFCILLVTYVKAQSGDEDWLIPVPLQNTSTKPIHPQTSSTPPVIPIYPYYDYDQSDAEIGSGIGGTILDPYKNVVKQPLVNPPCLLPERQRVLQSYTNQRHFQFNERRALSLYDLLTEKVQIAGYLAVSEFMNKNNMSKLELVQFLGGCRMSLAGELIFLIFNAKEIVPCIDGVASLPKESFNCTSAETAMVFNRECRARVHITNFAPWRPFYVSCKSPEFFALPWRKIQY